MTTAFLFKPWSRLKVFFVVACILSCRAESSSTRDTVEPSVVTKIVKTRTFSAKQEFENLVPFEPAPNLSLGPSSGFTLEMDLSWSNRYFDEHGNLVKHEKVSVDKAGNESIYATSEFFFSIPKDGQLEREITGDNEVLYFCDSLGRTTQIIKKYRDEIKEKVLLSYSESTGELKRKEVFERDGLIESTDYFSDVINLIDSQRILNHVDKYRIDREVQAGVRGKKVKSIERKYNDLAGIKLISELVTEYDEYVGDTPTKETTSGFTSSVTTFGDGRSELTFGNPSKTTILRELNERDDLVKYIQIYEQLEQTNEATSASKPLLEGNSPDVQVYTGFYYYNEYNDWVELILNTGGKKFIVKREITYVD